jgi:hypothetical protein
MTRARALKQVIRARAAKTGERYTAARRHVLNSLKSVDTRLSFGSTRAPAGTAPQTSGRRTGMSEEKCIEKTGHGFDHWFAVLDRFGAVEKGHTAAARHLYTDHGVPGWYAQGITVAYERARGVRTVNQRCDGGFEVSVSKTVSGAVPAVIKVLTTPRLRNQLETSDGELVSALANGLDSPRSKGVVVRPDGLGRFRYQWGGTTVQWYFLPKPGNKVSVVVTNMKLADGRMVEQRRAAWRQALNSLATLMS